MCCRKPPSGPVEHVCRTIVRAKGGLTHCPEPGALQVGGHAQSLAAAQLHRAQREGSLDSRSPSSQGSPRGSAGRAIVLVGPYSPVNSS